jgi:Protein of unknown function (DUF3103)
MKKTLQRLGIVTVGLSLCLWSCKEQDKNVQPSEDVIAKELSQNEHFTRMEEVAKALAKSMGDKQVRNFIKLEASKQIDGDYDILYNWVDDKTIGGKSLESIIIDNTVNSPSAKTNALENLRVTAASIPLLNISVPANIDKWDTENFEPLVAVSPYSFVKDEKSVKLIKAYDSQGNIHWLDAKKKPDYPVIAVGLNERSTVKDGKIELKPIAFSKKNNNTDSSNKLTNPVPFDSQKKLMSSRAMGGQSWYYSEYSDEIYLNGIADGNGWDGMEDWLMGDPEIEVYTFVKNNQGQVYNAGLSYHDINDDGIWAYTQMNFAYTAYDVDLYPEVYMAFWEDDGGSSSGGGPNTQTVTSGVTYGVGWEDDFMGAKWMNRIYYPSWWWEGKGYVHKLDVNKQFFIKVSGFTGRTDK